MSKENEPYVLELEKKVAAFRKALINEKKRTKEQMLEIDKLKKELRKMKSQTERKEDEIGTLRTKVDVLKEAETRYVSQFGDINDPETQERISVNESLGEEIFKAKLKNAEQHEEMSALQADNNRLYEKVQERDKKIEGQDKELEDHKRFSEILAQKLFAYKMRLENFEVIVLKFTVFQVFEEKSQKPIPAQIIVKRIPSRKQMILCVSSQTHDLSQDVRMILNVLNDMHSTKKFTIYFSRDVTLHFEVPEGEREKIVTPIQDIICAIGGNEGRPIMRYRKDKPNSALAMILRQHNTNVHHEETGIFSKLKEYGISLGDEETSGHLEDLFQVI